MCGGGDWPRGCTLSMQSGHCIFFESGNRRRRRPYSYSPVASSAWLRLETATSLRPSRRERRRRLRSLLDLARLPYPRPYSWPRADRRCSRQSKGLGERGLARQRIKCRPALWRACTSVSLGACRPEHAVGLGCVLLAGLGYGRSPEDDQRALAENATVISGGRLDDDLSRAVSERPGQRGHVRDTPRRSPFAYRPVCRHFQRPRHDSNVRPAD